MNPKDLNLWDAKIQQGMVSFTEIALAIAGNSEKEFSVPSCIPKHPSVVPLLKLQKESESIKDPFEKIALKMQTAKPVPTPKTPVLKEDTDSEPDLAPVPSLSKVSVPVITVALGTPMPAKPSSLSPQSKPPKEQSVESPKKSKQGPDPICIAIGYRDPMYEIASASVRQSIEAEEARILESKIAEIYKNESGRSRGWTKTALDAFFLVRAASGGHVPAKQTFDWSAVFTDKQTSALLDFICLAKGIRLAVWNTAEKCVGIWPAADLSTGKETPPLFHVSHEGHALGKTTVFEPGWTLRAPQSVEHGLEKLSLDELDSLAEKMGVEPPTGKKAERVRALASKRTELRLR